MTTVSAKAARQMLSELISRTAFAKERVVITRSGKRMAALVPIEDLDLLEMVLEELEYQQDVAEARAALAEVETEGTIPWEKIKADLGL